uniref:Uncharacterized protein n=1 Tax=Arundo donax TaxID=35708 RepID=A0A0A9EDV2_ARUDO
MQLLRRFYFCRTFLYKRLTLHFFTLVFTAAHALHIHAKLNYVVCLSCSITRCMVYFIDLFIMREFLIYHRKKC